MLIITAADIHTYDAFMLHLKQENPNEKRFVTNVALGVVKRGLAVAIPLEPPEC